MSVPDPMDEDKQHLYLFPYLNLQHRAAFGPWRLYPAGVVEEHADKSEHG